MDDIIILPSVLKHGLSEDSLREAWDNFAVKRQRGQDCWVVIGSDGNGTEIEMVGLVTIDGKLLIIHGLNPATEKIKRELSVRRKPWGIH